MINPCSTILIIYVAQTASTQSAESVPCTTTGNHQRTSTIRLPWTMPAQPNPSMARARDRRRQAALRIVGGANQTDGADPR